MVIKKIDNTYPTKLPSPVKTDKGHGFKRIFDRKMAQIDATTPQSPVDVKADVLQHGVRILDLLDDYGKKLNDPAKTLKDIEPLVESISKEVRRIEAEAAEKVSDDRELEELINDLAVTADVAVFKFYRGDYI